MNIIFAFSAAAIGFFVSGYLFFKKRAHQKLACPRENPCGTVVHSRFAKTLGVPNEIFGMLYFLFVIVLLALPVSEVVAPWMLYVLFIALMVGALFSLYLTGVQAFVIRSWCAWCLFIAFLNAVLIISLSTIPVESFVSIIKSHKVLWVIVHNIGFILGVGAATISDVFFFRFLKDGAISQEEKETMDTLSSVIWIGLGLLVLSGLMLFFSDVSRLSVSSKFLTKVVVVGVIIVNGVLLNMFIAPHMRRLSFQNIAPIQKFRRLAFSLGAVSIVSWYVAFFLGSFRKIQFSFSEAVRWYFVLLIAVIVGAQIAERYITKRRQQKQG